MRERVTSIGCISLFLERLGSELKTYYRLPIVLGYAKRGFATSELCIGGRTTAHENHAFYDISCISSDFQGSIKSAEDPASSGGVSLDHLSTCVSEEEAARLILMWASSVTASLSRFIFRKRLA